MAKKKKADKKIEKKEEKSLDKKLIEGAKEVLDMKPKSEPKHERVENPKRRAKKYKDFEDFWFKIKKERNLDDRWRRPLILHLKAIKCWHPDKYDEGVENFGL